MAIDLDQINEKYNLDGSITRSSDPQEPQSAQKILDQRAAQSEQRLSQLLSRPIDPARAVMREHVNLGGPQHGGLNFERYYNKGAYNKLGFNPYRNNEEYYNKNSSAWEDYMDANKQAWNLAGLGFTSVLGGKSDREEAEKYARYSNIGSTTRGGFFGTMTNAQLNSGYTIGLLAEIAAEEIGLAILAAGTGGGETPLMLARSAKNLGRLKKAFSFGNKMSSLIGRIKNLKTAAQAKTFWEGARKVGQAVNPLRGGTEYLATQYTKDVADGLSANAALGRTFGAFYRDLREINLAYDEAQLESGFVSNGIKDDLIREHINSTGEFPSTTDMAKINKEALQAAENTKAVNTSLIYATNRISFGNVFNKWMPARLRKSTAQLAGGKVVKNFKTGKLDPIEGGGFLNYKLAINQAKYAKKNLNRAPLEAAKILGRYTRANVGEGVQEYFQEVIQDAEDTMAKDRYAGTVAGGAWYNALHGDAYMNQYAKSMNKYVSEEGLDVFTGGFVMGMFAGPFARGSQVLTKQIDKHGKRLYDKEGYIKEREDRRAGGPQERFRAEVDRFNAMTDTRKKFLFNYIDMLQRQTQYAAKMDDDQDKGDKKSYITTKDHALVKQMLWAQSMGAEDLVLQKLKDLAEMSEEDLNDAFSTVLTEGGKEEPRDAGELVKNFKESAEKIIKRAENIMLFSKQYDKLFPEPVGAGTADSEFGDPRAQRSYLKDAWQEAKAVAITHQQDLVRSMERAQSILTKTYTNPPFWNKAADKTPPAQEITRLFNTFDSKDELDLLDDEIANLEGIPPADRSEQDKKDLKYKKEMLRLLSDFLNPKGPLAAYRNALTTQEYLDLKAKQIEEAGDLEEGSTIRYSSSTASWGGKIIGETTRKSDGKPQWIIEREHDGSTTRILKDSPRIVTEEFDAEEAANTMVEPTAALKAFYKEYLETVGKYYDNPLNDSMFEESFNDFADFFALKEDTKNLSDIVNMIANPEAHLALIERFEALRRAKFENMEETVMSQLETYAQSVWLHKLIESLARNHNVYIHEDELAALLNDQQIPEVYFHIETNEPLRKNTVTYFKVRKAVRTAMEEEGLIEPEVVTEHTVRKEEDGTFTIVSPEDIVIQSGIETEEEANTIAKELDVATEEPVEEKPKAPKAPTKKPAKPKPITFDTPIEEWPESILTVAEQSLANYNEAQKKAGGIEIEDVESYLTSDAAKLSKPLQEEIKKYNDSLKEAAPTPTPKAGTAPPEEVITATQEEVLGQLDILKQRRAETELTSKGYIYLNKLYQRVSHSIKEQLKYDSKNSVTNVKNSLPVGNFIDEVARVVFNNSEATYEEFQSELENVAEEKKTGFDNINTEEYFNSVKGHVLSIKQELIKKHGEKAVFFTDEIFINNDLAEKIADEFDGIGGVPDMIVIEEDGSTHIYDFKNKTATSALDARNKIESTTYGESNLQDWGKQQSAYTDLLEVNGIKVSSINAVVFPTQYTREAFTEEFEAWTKEGKAAGVELTEEEKAKIEAFTPSPIPVGTLTKEPFIAELKYEKIIPEDVPVEEPVVEEVKEPKKPVKPIEVSKAKVSTLSPSLEEQVFEGKLTLITLPSMIDKQTGVHDYDAILKPNQDGNILNASEQLKPEHEGITFVMSRENEEGKQEYVQLTYLGHKAFDEVEITDPLNQLDLKETRDEGDQGPYKNLVVINGKEYYAANSVMSGWAEGTGKLRIFEVSPPFEEAAPTSKDSPEAWKKTIENRLNNSKNIEQTIKEVRQDNVLRQAEGRPFVSTEEIEQLYNAAVREFKTGFATADVQLQDHYNVGPMEIDGKIVNFGTAKVVSITNTGITLQSTGAATAGQTKLIKPEDMKKVIKSKIEADTDIQADVADQLTEEEIKPIEDSKKSSEKLGKDAERVKGVLAKAKTKAKKDVDDKFLNNLGCN